MHAVTACLVSVTDRPRTLFCLSVSQVGHVTLTTSLLRVIFDSHAGT